jgi:predicted transcriptional regulator
MGSEKKEQKQTAKTDSLWRKPITLASFEDDDPLATLYRGREASEVKAETEIRPAKTEKPVSTPASNKTKNIAASKTIPVASKIEQKAEEERIQSSKNLATSKAAVASLEPKISEAELKSLLKIRSDAYHFTDLREILRGKSFDIYAYLRFLSNEAGVCKIKHLDLMKKLDISRPTLFKQGDWLVRLGLIEKRNVPGDHLGTSYTVYRLEEILPVPEMLVKQLDSQIENYRKDSD